MTDVKNSTLYKTLKKAVRKEDHAELLRMLEMVPDEYPNNLGRKHLVHAFTWSSTPQGFPYWAELYNRLKGAGHDQ